MKRKDLLIVLCILTLSAGMLLLARATSPAGIVPAPQASGTTGGAGENGRAGTSAPLATLAPADCYLLVTVGDVVLEPYPLLEERDLPITQADGRQNVAHVSPTGFYMSSATCDNQDCVHQGEVTLANRNFRILGNQVVCLPNKVMLELLTPEEAMVVWGNAHADRE